MAQWQRTNPNFSGANGALAVASGSFAKAGGLAAQLSNSIRQRDMNEAKKASLLTSTMNDSRKTNYLVNTDQRKLAMEKYQFDLNKHRANQQNQQILQAQQGAMPVAKQQLRNAFEQTIANKYGKPIDPEVLAQAETTANLQTGQFGPARPSIIAENGQPLAPEQVQQNQQVENQFQTVIAPQAQREAALAQWDKLSPKVARKDLYKATLVSLLEQNTGLPLETLQTKAMAYVNQELGALPDADTLKSQRDMTDKIYEQRNEFLQEAMKKLLGQDKTGSVNVAINGTSGGNYRNSNGSTASYENDPAAFNKWLGKYESHNGPVDLLFNISGKTQSVNRQDVKEAYLFYKTKFGITDRQFMSYMNGAIKDGVISDDYGPEDLFPAKPDSKPNKKQAMLAQDMQKMGADKTSIKAKGFSPNGAITDLKAAKAMLGDRFKQYKNLSTQQQQLTKEYMASRGQITASQVGKSRNQIVDDFVKTYIEPVSTKVAPKMIKVATKQEDVTKTNLFKDKTNPIAVAMRTQDPKGESSLAKFIKDNPSAYQKYFKKLPKAEQASVVKYVRTNKFKSLLKSTHVNKPATGNNTVTTPDVTQQLLQKHLPSISVSDLGSSYDTVALRKQGYIPEYNSLNEVIGWRNPKLEHLQKIKERQIAANHVKNIVNPTGSSKFGFTLPTASKPTANDLYMRSLINR